MSTSTGSSSNLTDATLNVTAAAITTTTTTTADLINTSTVASPKFNFITQMSVAAAAPIDPLSHVGDGIFLQTKTAQGLAGVFVWAALFITCQQVGGLLIFPSFFCLYCILVLIYVYLLFVYFLCSLDLSTFALVHEPPRATLDCTNFIYCTHLCNILLDKFIIL